MHKKITCNIKYVLRITQVVNVTLETDKGQCISKYAIQKFSVKHHRIYDETFKCFHSSSSVGKEVDSFDRDDSIMREQSHFNFHVWLFNELKHIDITNF
ncbi:hypothetical protein SAGN_02337 [Staphylococcus agnetis]|nr:hypothetical protein SAGN_02337 [Staphylococcus agnetis]